jgi:hypothetical protein
MTAPNYTIPNQLTTVLDSSGRFQSPWWRFLYALWTGTGQGIRLGTAATKNATNSGDANVASVTPPIVSGHLAKFADTNGTISDAGSGIGTSGSAIPLLNADNTWSGVQTFSNGSVSFSGSSSGNTLLEPATTASGTLTLPAATDTLVARATTDTLTNKTMSGAANTFSNISPASILSAPITNSLTTNVTLNSTSTFFDGPSVAQGSTGTWFVSGSVVVADTSSATAAFYAKLWDGTTLIASGYVEQSVLSGGANIALSGFIASPAGNLRISVRDATSTSGVIGYSFTGLNMDSTITAFRIK